MQYSGNKKNITCFVILKISKSVLFVSSSGERSSLTWRSEILKSGSLALTTVAKKLNSNDFCDLVTNDDFFVRNRIDYFKLSLTSGVFQTGAAENGMADFNKINPFLKISAIA